MTHKLGPLLSSRTLHFKVFITAIMLSVVALVLLAVMMISISQNARHEKKLRAETNVYSKLASDMEARSELNGKQKMILEQIARFVTNDISVYTPIKYMAALEHDRPDFVRFDELVFDREKGKFSAIVVAAEYKDVVAFLQKVEEDELFSLAEIKKRGREDRDGVRYHLEFVISRVGS